MSDTNSLLTNLVIAKWCLGPLTENSLINTSNSRLLKVANDQEKEMIRSIIGGIGNQWTTMLCQDLVKEVLIKLNYKNVRRPAGLKSTVNKKGYSPDIESDEFIFEVKGRSWTTPGTAGEKILGVPIKYGELPKLYKKPLKIVLVGYQEYEARNGFAAGNILDPTMQSVELRESLQYFKEHGIEYVGLTDLLRLIVAK